MVESVACSGCEVWLPKREEQRKLLALETDFIRSLVGVSRLQKISKITIRSKMQEEQSMLDSSKKYGLLRKRNKENF